jgi:hypothetical protein
MDALLIFATLTLLRLVLPFGTLLLIGTLVEKRNQAPAH